MSVPGIFEIKRQTVTIKVTRTTPLGSKATTRETPCPAGTTGIPLIGVTDGQDPHLR